jgi:hypothetical protein
MPLRRENFPFPGPHVLGPWPYRRHDENLPTRNRNKIFPPDLVNEEAAGGCETPCAGADERLAVNSYPRRLNLRSMFWRRVQRPNNA